MTDPTTAGRHPRHEIDDALLTPLRFSVMATLRMDAEIDFATLRDLLESEDSSLSNTVAHLKRVGYVAVRTGYVANRPRTWLKAPSMGKSAMLIHVAELQAIASGAITSQ